MRRFATWKGTAMQNPADALEVDFDRLLDPAALVERICETPVRQEIAAMRALYARHHPARVARGGAPRIPKIIHQIWMGSPVPQDLQDLAETWRRLHPDWEYRLWTDAEIARIEFGTKDLFEKATCYAQKSDILRAELVLRHGGVYVDFDYHCFKPIDAFAHGYDFFGTTRNILVAHLGWSEVWPSPIVVCNSLFGARPGHPILFAFLERVREHWHDEQRFRFQESELPRMSVWVMGGERKLNQIKEEGLRTYLPFSEVVLEGIGREGGPEVLLPTAYFNPVVLKSAMLYLMPEFWHRCWSRGVYVPKLASYSGIPAYSYANHISKARWLR
jgi:mannosyltransferase OCH1-like enzyme